MLRFIITISFPGFDSFRISIHLMLRFIFSLYAKVRNFSNFNTSHVTVYLRSDGSLCLFTGFQYISCYGLSLWVAGYESRRLEFQYISCYGLSTIIRVFCIISIISIHLMLRFILLYLPIYTQ